MQLNWLCITGYVYMGFLRDRSWYDDCRDLASGLIFTTLMIVIWCETEVRTYPFVMPLYRCAHACGHWTVVCSLLHTKIGPFREMASLLILFKILYIVTGVSPGGSLPTHRNQNKTNVRFLPLERLALASSIFSLLSPPFKAAILF